MARVGAMWVAGCTRLLGRIPGLRNAKRLTSGGLADYLRAFRAPGRGPRRRGARVAKGGGL